MSQLFPLNIYNFFILSTGPWESRLINMLNLWLYSKVGIYGCYFLLLTPAHSTCKLPTDESQMQTEVLQIQTHIISHAKIKMLYITMSKECKLSNDAYSQTVFQLSATCIWTKIFNLKNILFNKWIALHSRTCLHISSPTNIKQNYL